jgi:tRNA dimethylallyltransferase
MRKDVPLIVILGPTAVGKTETAISVAEKVGGEIISADSRLFYRGMDIGTAKPTRDQLNRVPHHLIDVSEPDEEWSLAKFSSAVAEIIDEIHERDHIPFLVGGTGQYIRAIVEGWMPPPRAKDDPFRERMLKLAEQEGKEALHQILKQVDPESAARIAFTNVRRVVRALEIHHLTGKPASHQRTKVEPPYRVLQIGLTMPREQLYERIDARIDRMLADGLEEEVRSLLDQGYSTDLPAMSAIGYKQIGKALLGEVSMEDAVQEMRRLTRQFVRRQSNWFKPDDPKITWIEVKPGATRAIIQAVETFLRQTS